MRCYICNKETDNFRKDYDGRYVSICTECRRIIRDMVATYEDVEDDVLEIEQPSIDIIESIDRKE